MNELNILLLGETGVGKSTWINGFVNYLTFNTLDEAESGENVCLIPMTFTMTDENYEERRISWGPNDRNECHLVGASSTQQPVSYVFKTADTTVRIIDTPGIGDTRGIDQDKRNMQSIMTHLSRYEKIHGICILLKPNSARLTVMFEFCIKELLSHLHKDATKNMVVCFTNARSTFYRPGDTLGPLQKLLKENDNIPIQLSKSTIYCMDNESVRFLAAMKGGIEFDEMERDNYAASWKKSVDEAMRMMRHISSLLPHAIKQTLSLNEARRSILAISRPIAVITTSIQNNINDLKEKEAEEISLDASAKDLANQLYVPKHELITTKLNYPTTVCGSAKCAKTVPVSGGSQRVYPQRCHENCSITTGENQFGCPELQYCAAMDSSQTKCMECGCGWDVHMHITYETKEIVTKMKDPDVEKRLGDKQARKDIIEQHKRKLKAESEALESEKKTIAEVSAMFACFLKNNAIAPYNDALMSYLDHIIKVEEAKPTPGGSNATLEGLRGMRDVYTAEIKTLQDAMKSSSEEISVLDPAKIQAQIQKLYDLTTSGRMLADMMKVVDEASEDATASSEKVVQVETSFVKLMKSGFNTVQSGMNTMQYGISTAIRSIRNEVGV
jgi:GTPase SAR1 family protein